MCERNCPGYNENIRATKEGRAKSSCSGMIYGPGLRFYVRWRWGKPEIYVLGAAENTLFFFIFVSFSSSTHTLFLPGRFRYSPQLKGKLIQSREPASSNDNGRLLCALNQDGTLPIRGAWGKLSGKLNKGMQFYKIQKFLFEIPYHHFICQRFLN